MGTHFCVQPQCQHLSSSILSCLPQFYSMQCFRHKYEAWNTFTPLPVSQRVRYGYLYASRLTKVMHCFSWLHVSRIPVQDECNYNRSPGFQTHRVDTDLSTHYGTQMLIVIWHLRGTYQIYFYTSTCHQSKHPTVQSGNVILVTFLDLCFDTFTATLHRVWAITH